MPRQLTPEGDELAAEFILEYGSGNCACHISPPCGSCIHPGNPMNLEETPEMWEEVAE